MASGLVNNPMMRLQHLAFQVYFMRLIGVQQSEAQFYKTALLESKVLMTHGNSIAVHNEFLLSLWAMPDFMHIISFRLPGVKNPVV